MIEKRKVSKRQQCVIETQRLQSIAYTSLSLQSIKLLAIRTVSVTASVTSVRCIQ